MASALAGAYVAHPNTAIPNQQFAPPTTFAPPPNTYAPPGTSAMQMTPTQFNAPPPSTGLSVNTYGQPNPQYPAYPIDQGQNLDPEAQKDNAELEAFLKDLTIKDRMMFLRKVYMILFFQLGVTAVVSKSPSF
jgi:hypothetical protein